MFFYIRKVIIGFFVFGSIIPGVSQDKNDYQYSRENKIFKVFSNNKDISNEVTFISNFNTLNNYVYVPKSKTLLKLSYYEAYKNKFSVAEKIYQGKSSDFVLIDDYGNLHFYCEGTIMEAAEIVVSTPNNKLFVMSPKQSNYTYKFLYTKGFQGVLHLEKLPPNEKNTYWQKTLDSSQDNLKSDFTVYINAEPPMSNNLKVIDKENIVFSIESKYYHINNFKSAKMMGIYPLKEISENTYNKLVQIRKNEPTLKTNSVHGCNFDPNCLVKRSETKYSGALGQGKSQEQAYDAMTKVFTDTYNTDPKIAYEMLMSMKNEDLLEVIKRLPADVRAHIRSMSMSTIKKHENKYGPVEIKTVPYKPKKN